MNRGLYVGMRVAAGLALSITLVGSTSCEYFDPLDPFNRDLSDADTSITWERVIGGSGDDGGMSVEQTSDGGYIITGYRQMLPVSSDYDIWLIKTDSSGTVEWDKTYDGFGGEDQGYCVHQSDEGGYIIVGYVEMEPLGSGNYDVWLIKTDDSGDREWYRTYGGINGDFGFCVQVANDGGYIITGETSSYGSGASDVWLVKTDSLGIREWDNTFGDAFWDYGTCVGQTIDGGYIISGVFRPEADDYQAYLVKTNDSGDYLWSKRFGTSIGTVPDTIDRGAFVLQTPDGGYILAGETHSFGAGDFDAWMIKTDDSGTEEWSKTFGDSAHDRADAIQQTTDGGYIIAGMTRSGIYHAFEEDVWLIKTDASGEELWNKSFGGSNNDGAYSVQQTDDGGYIAVGYTNSFAGSYNVYLIYYKP